MSYQATAFNVMIASPSDVPAEREQVRAVIYEWNAIHSMARKIVLLPVGWETHASPQMGGSPQSIINDQVLARADLVVGVFWTRIGTKTDDYDSGTVEEIERHIAAGRPAMLYFSSSPVELDSVDHEQYLKLKTFKASCKSRGLYEPYSGIAEFRAAFNRHLQLQLNEHAIFQADGAPMGDPSITVEAEEPTLELSEEARALLKAASTDKNGVIIHAKFIGGTSIQTNGIDMIPSEERRVIAAWEGALESLVLYGLVQDRGHKGEVYQVTNEGYRVSDLL
jgi:hypothetical protein